MEIPHSERLKRARDTIREELQVISERREALEGKEEEANERIRAAKERRMKEREEKRNGRYAGNHEKVGA